MLAAIADGSSRIRNFALNQDCLSTVSCLEQLGISIERDGSDVIVHGKGKLGLKQPSEPLDCGNSGTTMRLISGILAGQPFASTLTGDASLSRRPMGRIIEPLEQMGALCESSGGRAPFTISGRSPLAAVEYTPPVASAQIKSCVLLAGLYADGITSVIEPIQTRDHTERMLRWLGVDVAVQEVENGTRICVSGSSQPQARDLNVPADISSAAFFMVAAAVLPDSSISLPNVGLNPSRRAVIETMIELGADISIEDEAEQNKEPSATIRVKGGLRRTYHRTVISGETIANLIDEIPILAVLGTQLENGLEIRDAAELRVKESDRIKAVITNLRAMGADVDELPDGMVIRPSRLTGAAVETFHDHRIAMAFAIAGCIAEGDTEIRDAETANVSFPGFYEKLDSFLIR